MVLKFCYRGLMAPVFSCFKSNPKLDLDVSIIPMYAEFLKTRGVNGVLVNGTTGEHVLMSSLERKSAAATWTAAGKLHHQAVMVQVGGGALPDVLDMAKHAEEIEASGILCLPDLFFKPRSNKQLMSYLNIVSQAAPKTPLFYYHNPLFTHVNLPMSHFLKEAKNEIPTLSGIKFTSNDLDEGHKCLNIDENLTIFLGGDTIFSAALTLGFNSAIMSVLNFWPEDFRQIVELHNNGQIDEARSIQLKVNSKLEKLLSGGNRIGQIKAYMCESIHFPVGASRLSLIQY